jgi:hypothetical protein
METYEKYLNESPFRFDPKEIAAALKLFSFLSNEAGGLRLQFEPGKIMNGKVRIEVKDEKQSNMNQQQATTFLAQYL